MGFDICSLSNKDCKMYINNISWEKLLGLANMYGWKPAKTESMIINDVATNIQEPGTKISDDYFVNDGQIITSVDASKIADALEAALDDIPDIKTKDNRIEFHPGDEISGTNIIEELAKIQLGMGNIINIPNSKLHPFDYFSGDSKNLVIFFIKMCRLGAIEIW